MLVEMLSEWCYDAGTCIMFVIQEKLGIKGELIPDVLLAIITLDSGERGSIRCAEGPVLQKPIFTENLSRKKSISKVTNKSLRQ